MVNSFFEDLSSDVTLKLAQCSALEGLLETALRTSFHEIDVQSLHNQHYPYSVEDFLTLAVTCNTHLGFLEDAVNWCKKLANHRHLNLKIVKDTVFDSFSTLEKIGMTKNPDQFSDLQRRYRSTLDRKEQVLLAQIECAESFSLLGELFMRTEDYQVTIHNRFLRFNVAKFRKTLNFWRNISYFLSDQQKNLDSNTNQGFLYFSEISTSSRSRI